VPVGETIMAAASIASALGSSVNIGQSIFGGLFGDDDGGRGSDDVRDPEYHGDHWQREAQFRGKHCGTYAAPTGRVRDREFGQRKRALSDLLGQVGRQRMKAVATQLGIPERCRDVGDFFGVGPVPANVPHAGGWREFSLSPSPFQQVAAQLRMSEAQLFAAIMGGGPTAAPPPAPQETDMGVGAAIGDFLSLAGDFADFQRTGRSGPVYTNAGYGNAVPQYQPANLGVLGPAMGGAVLENLFDVLPGMGGGGHLDHTRFARERSSAVGMAKEVHVMGPNGKQHTYRNKGRTLLFADDLAAVKRVRRAAAQANRACGGARRGRR